MSTTDFGALTAAQKKLWAVKIWEQGRDRSFWFSKGFVGKNANDTESIIHRVTELTETERGAKCVMQIVADLAGDGVVGDNRLEGNEEALINDEQEIEVDQLRHGVKSAGEMSEQRTVVRFRSQAKDKLAFWLSDTLDELMFLTASGRAYTLKPDGSTRTGSQLSQLAFASDVAAASTNRLFHAGNATGEGNITASDTVSWNEIVNICSFAKRKRIRPIRSGGKEYYALLLTTEQMRDLKKDDDYQNINKDGGKRGDKNPLFTGATSVVDGVVIHEHNKVFNTLGLASASKWGAGGLVDGAQALLMGSQALGLATIGSKFTRESSDNDYGNQPGMAYGQKVGMLKPQFITPNDDESSAEDYGIISFKTAAASLAA